MPRGTTATAASRSRASTRSRQSGYFLAPIPEELGGLGVVSLHDLVVAQSRLARGDAALALGVNMHFVLVLSIPQRWQLARATGDERRMAAFGESLEEIVRERMVLAAAISEPTQDLTRPTTMPPGPRTAGSCPGRRSSARCRPAPTSSTRRSCCRRQRPRALRLRRHPARHAGRRRPRRLGRARHARLRQQFRLVRGRAPSGAALRGGFAAGDADEYMERTLELGRLPCGRGARRRRGGPC